MGTQPKNVKSSLPSDLVHRLVDIHFTFVTAVRLDVRQAVLGSGSPSEPRIECTLSNRVSSTQPCQQSLDTNAVPSVRRCTVSAFKSVFYNL